jgi:hypothetical protein
VVSRAQGAVTLASLKLPHNSTIRRPPGRWLVVLAQHGICVPVIWGWRASTLLPSSLIPAPPQKRRRVFKSRRLKRTHRVSKLGDRMMKERRAYTACFHRPRSRRALLLLLVWAGGERCLRKNQYQGGTLSNPTSGSDAVSWSSFLHAQCS